MEKRDQYKVGIDIQSKAQKDKKMSLQATASDTTFVKKQAEGIIVNDHEDKKRKRVITNEEKAEIHYTKDLIPTQQYMVKYIKNQTGHYISDGQTPGGSAIKKEQTPAETYQSIVLREKKENEKKAK